MVASLEGAAAVSDPLANAHSDRTDGAAPAPTSVAKAASTDHSNGESELPACANMCASCGAVAAPLTEQYGATLPTAFAVQAGSVASRYVVDASASGYQTRTSAIQGISTADATLNFVPAP